MTLLVWMRVFWGEGFPVFSGACLCSQVMAQSLENTGFHGREQLKFSLLSSQRKKQVLCWFVSILLANIIVYIICLRSKDHTERGKILSVWSFSVWRNVYENHKTLCYRGKRCPLFHRIDSPRKIGLLYSVRLFR